jgi:hypothetical protein
MIRVDLSGRPTSREWHSALGDVSALLKPGDSTSILVAAERFEGWGTGDWEDDSFRQNHDAQIRRIAIVTDEKWQDQALMFAGAGLRRVEIECFTPAEMPRARQWLTSAS